ncbi:hypothetical protein CCC_01612 [Paramagnetospirillum magnetotacticum MS-1]|uniref:Uncharacterized protein n=2 Tax=Paramagnetospirillum magnetotacticum TaxID=188 RepID=A0A0C2UV95_PARME|nr:hypothetical protein CCC_01612 [Paramagnetospirillum magnetotacticum MS-1]
MIAAIKNEVGASPLWATTSVQLRTEGKEDEIAEGLARSKLTTFTRILPVKQAELLTIYFEDADAAERFRAELVPSHKADGAPAQIYRLP